MAFTVISAKYPPHIDPTKCPLAYGDRAIPRLVNAFLFSPILLKFFSSLRRSYNNGKLIKRRKFLPSAFGNCVVEYFSE